MDNQAPPINQNPAPVSPPVNSKSILSNKLFLPVVVLLVFFFGGSGFLILNSRLNPQPPLAKIVPTSAPTPTPTPTDETADWKTYTGKYFSFKYPSDWTDNSDPASRDPGYLEIIELRIGVAVFDASYVNYSYEKGLERHKDRKSQVLKVDGREATEFEYVGKGDPLPTNYSIISVVVKGSDDTSYLIVFNGPRKDITDKLINQILSTFKFTDLSEPVACTGEAKLCPDGSAVGRTGPNCEFAPCPGE